MDYRIKLVALIDAELKKGMSFKSITEVLNQNSLFTPKGAEWRPGPLASFYMSNRKATNHSITANENVKIQTKPKIDSIETKLGIFMDSVFRMNIPRDKKVFVVSELNDILDKLNQE